MGRARVPAAHDSPWPHVQPACAHGDVVVAQPLPATSCPVCQPPCTTCLPTSTRLTLILVWLHREGKMPFALCSSQGTAPPAWLLCSPCIAIIGKPSCRAQKQPDRAPLFLESSVQSFACQAGLRRGW
jgi:hypothetical protein